jgi:hypothetical protein
MPCMRRWRFLGTILLLTPLAQCSYREHEPLRYRGGAIRFDAVPVMYDTSEVTTFVVSEDDWQRVASIFEPPAADSAAERRMIREAIGLFEQIAGGQTRICNDGRKNKGSGSGQADCVCESTNTTTYLRLLDEHGLLRWHEVMNRAFRGPLEFDTHWTAQIRDRSTGERYAVDSWYLENGRPPYVQLVRDWKRKKPFPADQQ